MNISSILFTRQMFKTFTSHLAAINPHLLCAHIAHSEGALLAKNCLTDQLDGLTGWSAEKARNHLITLTYGGVAPIPARCCHTTINNYSNRDIALFFVKIHLAKVPKPDYMFQKDEELLECSQKIYEWNRVNDPKNALTVTEIFEDLKRARDEACYIITYPHDIETKGLKITVVKSIAKKLHITNGDHAFSEETYQKALEDDIEKFRKDNKFP